MTTPLRCARPQHTAGTTSTQASRRLANSVPLRSAMAASEGIYAAAAGQNQPQESTIRLMTRLAIQHGAVNLSQGFPNEGCAHTPPPSRSRCLDII